MDVPRVGTAHLVGWLVQEIDESTHAARLEWVGGLLALLKMVGEQSASIGVARVGVHPKSTGQSTPYVRGTLRLLVSRVHKRIGIVRMEFSQGSVLAEQHRKRPRGRPRREVRPTRIEIIEVEGAERAAAMYLQTTRAGSNRAIERVPRVHAEARIPDHVMGDARGGLLQGPLPENAEDSVAFPFSPPPRELLCLGTKRDARALEASGGAVRVRVAVHQRRNKKRPAAIFCLELAERSPYPGAGTHDHYRATGHGQQAVGDPGRERASQLLAGFAEKSQLMDNARVDHRDRLE